MKMSITTLLFSLIASTGFTQTKTTLQDFTYINLALRDDLRTGRGIKSGYSVEPIGDMETKVAPNGKPVKVGLMYFKKAEEKVAIIIAVSSIDDDYGKAWCIPTLASDGIVWTKTYETIKDVDPSWSTIIIWGLMKAMSLKLL